MRRQSLEAYLADRDALGEEAFLSRHPWPVLVVEDPRGPALFLEVSPADGIDTERITVGRAPELDVVLADETISKIHAELSWDPARERCVLTDLGSRNGTFADGRRLPPQGHVHLTPGMSIGFGSLVARYYTPRAFWAWLASESSPRSPAPRARRESAERP